MPTFIELQERAIKLVNDPDLNGDIPALINQGVYEIAGGMLSSIADIVTPPLPKLHTINNITTVVGTGFVDMPDDFHRTLQFAVKANGTEVDIANSFIAFLETDPSMQKEGNVNEVIEHGRKLYYVNIPKAAEDITLHYYRKPVDMVDDDDEPEGIPEHLQISLLVNFAVWKAYELIEDGIDGETPNTAKYKGFFMEALRTLELSIPDYIRGAQLR